jgi:hypothetical protein
MAVEERPTSSDDGDPRPELAPAFEQTFAERLEEFLDLDSWRTGMDLERAYGRLQDELESNIDAAIAAEDKAAAALRQRFFRDLETTSWRGKPPLAGRWKVSLGELERVHRGTLFTGDVEACDGVVLVHDSLALTIMQFGVGLIGYRGDEGTWSCRLFRRDLSGGPPDSYEQALELIAAREPAHDRDDSHERVVAELGRRGLATFAQRAVLASKSRAKWRIGRGSPAPFELLTGSGAMRLVKSSVATLRDLLLGHKQFVFVSPTSRDRGLLTIGNALGPLEFAVLRVLRSEIEDVVERGGLHGEDRRLAQQFVKDVGGEVAIGVYRTSLWAPPRVFYAPAEPELCAQAAAIALADSVLQEHRGYPLLLEMARQFCAAAFGRDDFEGPIRAAYAAHDRALTYLSDI